MTRYYRKHNARENATALNALVYAGIGTRLLLSLVSSTALSLWPAPNPAAADHRERVVRPA
jgi:hypothetical protein